MLRLNAFQWDRSRQLLQNRSRSGLRAVCISAWHDRQLTKSPKTNCTTNFKQRQRQQQQQKKKKTRKKKSSNLRYIRRHFPKFSTEPRAFRNVNQAHSHLRYSIWFKSKNVQKYMNTFGLIFPISTSFGSKILLILMTTLSNTGFWRLMMLMACS